jgi:hypothetical protein
MADVLVPSGLAPGSQYQLIFVTSGTTTATSNDINYYNNLVESAANAAGIGSSVGITWTAVASTDSVDAFTNAPSVAPVYDLLGNLITPSSLYSSYTTPLVNLPVIDEYGVNIFSAQKNDPYPGFVWTGTAADGTGAKVGYYPSNDGTLGVPNPYPLYVGFSAFGDLSGVPYGYSYYFPPSIAWLTSELDPPTINGAGAYLGSVYAQTVPFSLYALSSVLTVPGATSTPEPGTLTLLGTGLVSIGGFVGFRRSRRHAST